MSVNVRGSEDKNRKPSLLKKGWRPYRRIGSVKMRSWEKAKRVAVKVGTKKKVYCRNS
jgi:hypothetical protein